MNQLEGINANLPVWIDKLYLDDAEEEKAEERRDAKLISADGRTFIWYMCKLFNVSHEKFGIAPQTCQILEKYFLSQTSAEGINTVRQQLAQDRMPLLVSACLWLSVKMQRGTGFMNGVTIQKILKSFFNHDYTVQEIIAIESKVFKAIGFRIPSWTTVEKALMLSQLVGVDGAALDGVCSTLNIAEYHRNDIVKQMLLIAYKTRPTLSWHAIKNIRNIHLAAASIVAYCIFLQHDGVNCLPRLAFIAKVTPDYLQCIANAILKHTAFEYVKDDDNNNPTETKRKRPNILKKK